MGCINGQRGEAISAFKKPSLLSYDQLNPLASQPCGYEKHSLSLFGGIQSILDKYGMIFRTIGLLKAVLVCQGSYNKIAQTGWLTQRKCLFSWFWSILVSSGCYSRVTGWLKQQTFYFSFVFWTLEVYEQNANIVRILLRAFFLVYRWLPSCCFHNIEERKILFQVSSQKGTNSINEGSISMN